MFIFAAKLNKRKAVIWLGVLAAVLVAIILIAGQRNKDPNDVQKPDLSTDSGRISYLLDLGLQVEGPPLEQQSIIIPPEFTGVYAEYSELQKTQGFDLEKYKGESAVRYTYKVLNYPGCTDTVVADMIICGGKLIAGDVQSLALDGFMIGLNSAAENISAG